MKCTNVAPRHVNFDILPKGLWVFKRKMLAAQSRKIYIYQVFTGNGFANLARLHVAAGFSHGVSSLRTMLQERLLR